MSATLSTQAQAGTILIVDDDAASLGVIAHHLEARGLQVAVAQDGEEALRRAGFVQPDLILLDVAMPGLSGFETCRRLKAGESTRDIPVIFMSGLGEAESKVSGFRAGGVDYLTKPFEVEEVLARVGTHLALRARQQELAEQSARLEGEIAVRKESEAALARARDELEAHVVERTAELALAKARLEAEVAERKRAEQALAESAARFRSLTELSSDWYWEQDEQFRFVDQPAEVLRSPGARPRDYLGRRRWEVHGTSLTPEQWAAHRAVLEQHLPFHDFEYERMSVDGAMRWVSVSGLPVFDAAGRFRGYRGIGKDITARKRAEQALAASEARYRSLVEMSPDAVVFGHGGTIQHANPAAAALFGCSAPEQLRGRRFSEFVHPDQRAKSEVRSALLSREPAVLPPDERRMLRADGTEFHAEITASSFRHGEGLMVQAIVRDITERKRADELLRLEHAVTLCLAGADTSSTGLKEVMRAIGESEGWECGRYFHVDEQAGRLRFGEAWGVADEAIQAYLAASRELVFGPNEGLAGRAWQSGAALWSADVSTDPRVRFVASVRTRIRGAFVFAVTFEGEVLGVMTFGSRAPRAPDERLLVAMRVIGSQIGQFLRRKRLEQALRSERDRLTSIIETMTEGLIIVDARGRYVLLNAAAERILGRTRDELLGGPCYLAAAGAEPPADGAPPLRHNVFLRLRAGEKAVTGESEVITRVDGSRAVMVQNGARLEDEAGRFAGALLTIEDVSERFEAEERSRMLLAATADGFAVVDRADRILEVNRALCEILGYREDELVGMYVRDIALSDPALIEQRIAAVIREGSARFESPHRRKDRSRVVLDVSVTSLPFGGGRLYAFFRDITERRAAEAEVRKLNLELEQRVAERTEALSAANRELEAFSYSVSHDLRAPLRAIGGFSRLLEEECAAQISTEGRRLLERIGANVARMAALIDGLLEFARLSRASLARARIEPAALVREVLEDLAAQRAGRKLEIVVGELPPCSADRLLLKQVYANLLSNALKYSARQEAARIEIGARRENGAPVYFVRDNGAGFDMRYGDKLFGVFQRLHGESEFEGTGIGLATVRRIIERHGGRAWAEGEPGRGATFYFTLPGPEAASRP